MTPESKLFQRNFLYLISICGLSRTEIANQLGVTRAAVTRWGKGLPPHADMLRRLSMLFTNHLHLEPHTLDYGQRLLHEDLEANLSIPDKGPYVVREESIDYITTPLPKISQDERNLILSLRLHLMGSRSIQLSPKVIDKIERLIIMVGSDVEAYHLLAKLMDKRRMWDQSGLNEQEKSGEASSGRPAEENDKTEE